VDFKGGEVVPTPFGGGDWGKGGLIPKHGNSKDLPPRLTIQRSGKSQEQIYPGGFSPG